MTSSVLSKAYPDHPQNFVVASSSRTFPFFALAIALFMQIYIADIYNGRNARSPLNCMVFSEEKPNGTRNDSRRAD